MRAVPRRWPAGGGTGKGETDDGILASPDRTPLDVRPGVVDRLRHAPRRPIGAAVPSLSMLPARARLWLRVGFGLGSLLLAAQFLLIVPAVLAWVNTHPRLDDTLQDA